MREQDPSPHTSWRPSGFVTLLTDFGLWDTYVGVMKGVLARHHPRARAVDLTHAVPPQDVRAAALHLASAWTWFPRGSVHVCVVDPGVGSGRRILVGEQRGHAFLAPDNGLLSGVLEPDAALYALDLEALQLGSVSRTFHGRDVFMPAAARLLRGRAPCELGRPVEDALRLEWPRPAREGSAWRASVVHADRFGNLRTCLTRADLAPEDACGWSAQAGGRALPVGATYADVAVGEALTLVDSSGYWELAVRDGSARAELGLEPGAEVRFTPAAAAAGRGASVTT
ncbi:MAG TPA: SAM-dependent chlorinase/fluorinase [Planctomycetota bacterium]|nr:SAM-dependent chlorinase/fluorinase [Planctomycetota bacterium]